jgi:nitrate/nitrite transporter NarK
LSSLKISLLSLIIFSCKLLQSLLTLLKVFLTAALSSPIGGKLSDRLPLYVVALAGFLVFVVGSVIYTVAAAQNLAVVIVIAILFEVALQTSMVGIETALQWCAYFSWNLRISQTVCLQRCT